MIKCVSLNALRQHIRPLAHFVVAVVCFRSLVVDPQWGTADAEIKVSSAGNSKRLKVLLSKPGKDQNIDVHTSPIARNFFLSDSYTTSGPFQFIFPKPLPRFFHYVSCGEHRFPFVPAESNKSLWSLSQTQVY